MKPNILLITADHMRHDALACNADPAIPHGLGHVVHTPSLDRLAATGTSFINSFTPNPICVPARASITTGNYPHKCTGSRNNGGAIEAGQTKLAEHFGSCGYSTYAVGKLHYVPYSPPGTPRLLHGFEVAEMNEEGRAIHRFDPLGQTPGIEDYHDWLAERGWGGYERAHGIGNNDVRPCASPLPADLHEESWVAERTVHHLCEHVNAAPNRPFLMWASFSKPHSPYDPPRPYDSRYDPRDIPPPLGDWEDEGFLDGRDLELQRRRKRYGWDTLSREAVQVIRAHYGAMVTFQDEMIGRILGFLDSAGIADNTIVIYTSDHGDLLGDCGRFFKTCLFDGSVRIPFLIRAPGATTASEGIPRSQLAGLQDILPTLAGLTQCPLPRPVDGMDLGGVLRDPEADGRPFYVSQTLESPVRKCMVRTPRWKYVYCELGGTEELYDVTTAAAEARNLAAEPGLSCVLDDLRRTLVTWCRDNGDTGMLTGTGLAASDPGTETPEFSARAMGWRRY